MTMCLGETVDGRVCETLEEIFRRVRFRSIDLEATSLDEEVSFSIFTTGALQLASSCRSRPMYLLGV